MISCLALPCKPPTCGWHQPCACVQLPGRWAERGLPAEGRGWAGRGGDLVWQARVFRFLASLATLYASGSFAGRHYISTARLQVGSRFCWVGVWLRCYSAVEVGCGVEYLLWIHVVCAVGMRVSEWLPLIAIGAVERGFCAGEWLQVEVEQM